jgi:putative transposase
MSKLRLSQDQMKVVLSELSAGRTVPEVSLKHGVSPRTLYRWRANLAREQQLEIERLRSLEADHQRLKNKFAELTLDYATLRAALIQDVKGDS